MPSSKKNTCPSCRITNLFQEHLPTSCEIEENNSVPGPLPGKDSNFMAVHTNECQSQNSHNNNQSIIIQKCQQVSWTIADRLFCAFVCAPAVVIYWRGGWSIMDNVLLPERRVLSACTSLFIGFFVNCIFTLLQNQFAAIRRDSIIFILFSRCYTAIFGLACINAWRGLWELLDIYAGKTVTSSLLTLSGALLSLIFLKGVKNLTSTPMILVTDNPKDYFKISTQYAFQCDVLAVKMGPCWGWWAKIADALYGAVIIGSLVVVFWRGLWIICDDFIYPQDLKLSGMVSLLIGYTFAGITYLLEPFVYRGCHYLKGLPRLLLADVYALAASVGAISVWRAVWCIFDWTWMMYTDSIWPAWAAHFGALFVMFLLYCSNTVLVRGVARDGAEPGGECITLQCTYFTSNDDYYFKQREKSSAMNSRALNIAASFETVECYM